MNTNGRRLWKHAAGWLTGIMVLSSACGTTAMANGVMLVETASVADVHAEADDTSPVLATLSGTQAKVLENSGRWMKVQVGDITGWVESEHLTDGSDTLDDIAPVNPEETQNPGDTEEQTEQTQDLQTEETYPADTVAQDRMSESSSDAADSAAKDNSAAEEAARKESEAQKEAEETERKAAEQEQAAAVRAAQQAVIAQSGVTPQDVELLAALIQCEAGGEPYVGQVAVGSVVMNRVEAAEHPSSIPDVIYAAGQFSPVRNGSLSRTLSTGDISQSCRQAAIEALAGSEPVGDKLYFRRVNGRHGQVIGNHVFY